MNVVITGATKGIGNALAHVFAGGGHHLAICARSLKDLNELQSSFIAAYPAVQVHCKAVDISQANDIGAFAAWLNDLSFHADVLINNAGYFAEGSIHKEAEGVLAQMLQTNLFGAYQLTRLLLPQMMQRASGHIVNVCSVAALQGFNNVGAYGISKYALLGFSHHLRQEMKPYGIRVTAVCPGATFTASWAGADIDPQRIMADQDVAQMIYAATLLSPQAVVEDLVMRPQQGDL